MNKKQKEYIVEEIEKYKEDAKMEKRIAIINTRAALVHVCTTALNVGLAIEFNSAVGAGVSVVFGGGSIYFGIKAVLGVVKKLGLEKEARVLKQQLELSRLEDDGREI